MAEIDFRGKLLFTNFILGTALWENPDGSTVPVTINELNEIKATISQIASAKRLSAAM